MKALAIILVLTAIVYAPVVTCDFINLDDPHYVTSNPVVRAGLSASSITWAFTTWHAGYWQPLTWLSLLADASLFGPNAAWGFHLTNLLWHLVNVALVYALFRRLTDDEWVAILACVLWAIHPLRVESVAWVTERKDVVSTCFGLLALLAYLRYVANRKWGWYGLSFACLALGLMTKPMLVTWPAVLLLLDAWPLGRWSRARWPWLLLEKMPFLLLAGGFGLVTFLAQQSVGAVLSFETLPLEQRLGNALVSWQDYLVKTLWPTDLAVFYPHPRDTLTPIRIATAALVLFGVTWVVRRRPMLLWGWLWFLGTALPVIGLSQAGEQGMADRFTYVPGIGLSLMLAGLVPRWSRGLVTIVAGVALSVATWRQVLLWKDCDTLYRHALKATRDNYRIHGTWGIHLTQRDQHADAIEHLRKSLELEPTTFPRHPEVPLYLGVAAEELGRDEESEAAFLEALRRAPHLASTRFYLGRRYLRQRQWDFAIEHLEFAVRLDPNDHEARQLLAEARQRQQEPK